MITFIIGKRTKAFETQLAKTLSGARDVERKTVTMENIRGMLDELQTPSLFGDKKTFVLSGLGDDDDVKKVFFDAGETISDAPNDAVIILESLLAADVKKAEKFATVQKITDLPAGRQGKEPKTAAFNPFVLGDAFASGDKKRAWIAFSQVVANSDEMEPTHGLVWWKLKDMMTKRSNFTSEQLKTMARDLVSVYHESRLGGLQMRERLEKFFLTLPAQEK